MSRTAAPLRAAAAALRSAALSYPEAYEESPWGERVVKVRGKIFTFVGCSDAADRLSLTAKLPETGRAALSLPFAEPCGYGLGKSGWVTARFGRDDDVPVDLLREWIDESFRAVAPRRLAAQLASTDGEPRPAPAARAAGTRSAATGTRSAAAKAKRAPTAKRAPKSARKVVIAGQDPLRLARGRDALAGRCAVDVCVLEEVRDGAGNAALLVVDLGRCASDGLAVLADVAARRGAAAAVVVAGIRDAAMERRAKAALPGAAAYLRGAPGDATVAATVAGAAEKSPRRRGRRPPAARSHAR